MKKFLSFALALILSVGLIPAAKGAFAADTWTDCGDDNPTVEYQVTQNGAEDTYTLTMRPKAGNNNVGTLPDNFSFTNIDNCTKITKVSVANASDVTSDEVLAKIKPSSERNSTFANFSSLSDISGLSHMDVEGAKNLGCMFENCSSLKDLSPIANWNVESVEIMSQMFAECPLNDASLESLKNWKTPSLIELYEMFSLGMDYGEEYDGFTTLDSLSNWDFSHVYSMSGVFRYQNKLSDISALSSVSFHKSPVDDDGDQYGATIESIFLGCTSLVDISVVSKWKGIENLTNIESAFESTGIRDSSALAAWGDSTKNITNMKYLFSLSYDLSNTFGISTWNFSGIDLDDDSESVFHMFSGDNLVVVKMPTKLTSDSQIFKNIAADLFAGNLSAEQVKTRPRHYDASGDNPEKNYPWHEYDEATHTMGEAEYNQFDTRDDTNQKDLLNVLVPGSCFVKESAVSTVNVSTSGKGAVTPSTKVTIIPGQSYNFNVSPQSGNSLQSLKLNGEDITSSVRDNKYTFTAEYPQYGHSPYDTEYAEENENWTTDFSLDASFTNNAAPSPVNPDSPDVPGHADNGGSEVEDGTIVPGDAGNEVVLPSTGDNTLLAAFLEWLGL